MTVFKYATSTIALFCIVALFSCKNNRTDAATLLNHAQKLHQKIYTIDSHVDIPGPEYATEESDPGIDNPDLRCDLVKMEKGGLDGVFLAVYVAQRPELTQKNYDEVKEDALVQFKAIHRLTDSMYPDRCALATTVQEFKDINASGKKAIMIGLENGFPVGENLDLVNTYYDLGARYITLSHSSHNQICDSSTPDEPLHNGLSEFGKVVVERMNQLGMMCDASHISEQSFSDLIETSKAPILVSHSGCTAVTEHNRNLTDDQLRALKKNGGVIQIVTLEDYLAMETPERAAAMEEARLQAGSPTWKEWQKMSVDEKAKYRPAMSEYWRQRSIVAKKYPIASIETFVNHIDHAVEIAGIDHVGIGTDFDGGGGFNGFQNHAEALNVTIELVKRGYSDEDIAKIWGGNLLRVWGEVEAVSKELKK